MSFDTAPAPVNQRLPSLPKGGGGGQKQNIDVGCIQILYSPKNEAVYLGGVGPARGLRRRKKEVV